MSVTKIHIKQFVKYGGHNLNANGTVNLTLISQYSQLIKTINLTQMLNNDIKLKVRKGNEKPFDVGSFRIKNIFIDNDGESKIKLNGIIDYIEVDNLNKLPIREEEVEEFEVLYQAEIELEENDENEE